MSVSLPMTHYATYVVPLEVSRQNVTDPVTTCTYHAHAQYMYAMVVRARDIFDVGGVLGKN